MAVAAAVALWLTSFAGPDALWGTRATGVVAVLALVLGLVLARFEGVGLALLLLGTGYAVILAVDKPPLDSRAALIATGLLVVGELAQLSMGSRTAVTVEAGAVAGRVAWVALLGVCTLVLDGAVLALADILRASGIAIELVGVGAAVAAVGLLTLAARDATRR